MNNQLLAVSNYELVCIQRDNAVALTVKLTGELHTANFAAKSHHDTVVALTRIKQLAIEQLVKARDALKDTDDYSFNYADTLAAVEDIEQTLRDMGVQL